MVDRAAGWKAIKRRDKPMRAKTFAEHRIHQYLEAVYPGLDGHMETVNAHEAIVTDINGDKIRVVYDRGTVYEIEM